MPSEQSPAVGRAAREVDDRGMVTAELAACLPVLVLVLAVALTAVSVVSSSVRAQDAAREAARATARGDDAMAIRLARAALPGASVVSAASGGEVTVTVTAHVHPLGDWLPSFTVDGHAVAALEPSVEQP